MAEASSLDPVRLFDAVRLEAAEPLMRLFHTGDELSRALAGQCDPSLEADLSLVRSALDKRLEKCVLTSAEAEHTPPLVASALRWVRLGRMGKVKLLNLIGRPDTSSFEDPLGGFASEPDATSRFAEACQRLSLAWSMAWPPHSADVLQFVTHASGYVLRQLHLGVDWATISEYWRGLMQRVDADAARFARCESHAAFRTAPKIDWIEGQFEYVRKLHEGSVQCRIDRGVESALVTFRSEFAAGSSNPATGDLKQSAKGLKRQGKRQRAAARKKANTGQPNPQPGPSSTGTAIVPYDRVAAAASVAAAALAAGGGGKPTGKEASAVQIAKEVAARVPEINGKKACSFFFGPQKSCRFSADQCGNGHHGQ